MYSTEYVQVMYSTYSPSTLPKSRHAGRRQPAPSKMSTPIPADAPDSSQSTVREMSTALNGTLSSASRCLGLIYGMVKTSRFLAATLPHRCQAGAKQGHGSTIEKERWLEVLLI